MQLQHLKHLYHARGQEVKTFVGKLEGNLDLVSYLPEHMGRIFPISAQSGLRIAFMGKELTFIE